MKNTMKKLLCMALAIMLLVSAVPVFAAAANVPVPYTIEIDGNAVKTDTYQANDTDSLLAMLGVIYPGYTAYQVAIKVDGVETSGDAAVPNAGTVLFELTTPPAPQVEVTITLSGVGSRVFNVEKGSKLTLNEALLTSHGLSLSYNHSIAQWNDLYNPTNPIANGTTVTVNDNNTFTCTQRDNSVGGNNGGSNGGSNNNNTPATKSVTLNIKNVEGGSVVWAKTDSLSGDTTTVKNLLYYWYGNKSNSWQNSYTFTKAYSSKQGKDVGYEGTIAAGDTVTVVLTPKSGSTVTPPPSTTTGDLSLVITANGAEVVKKTIQNFSTDTVANLIKKNLDTDWTSKYGFNEVIINGVTYYRSDLDVKAGDSVNISLSRKYSKDNTNKVYLHVYLNGDAGTIALTKDITGTYLMDDWTTDTTEILKYLKNNYYTAKDSSEAVTIDGLYVSENGTGTFPTKYYADKKVSSLSKINDLLEDNYVHISVMLKNAKAKSSATADTSNPKTGDTIFVPVMVMGLTASALAAAYVFGKKRIAR